MDYMITADPKGNSLYEPKFAESESWVEAIAERFFAQVVDEAEPGFVKGVKVYTRPSMLQDWKFDRYIENPAIDPFEGL